MRYKNIFIIGIIVFIVIILISSGNVMANSADITASIGDKEQLDKGILGFYTIQKKKSDGSWIYITYSIINYIDNNGDKHIAYCLDENAFGVGYVQGDVDGYEVELTKLIENEKIWRVIVNGYPYKTPEELGVETEDDAYLATKRAVYSMVSGYTEKDVRENYRVGQKSINGQNLEDIQRRGEKVIEAICKLVNIGNNGKETIKNELKIIPIGSLEEDEKNNCYYQRYKVSSNVEISQYSVDEIKNFPDETKIQDKNGKEKKIFNSNEEFRVAINKEKIKEDIKGTISVSAKCKTYPVYYAEAPEDYQDYAICSGYWDKLYSKVTTNIKVNESSLKIVKKDEKTKERLSDITFEIKYADTNEVLGTYKTNENGEIILKNLKPCTLIIEEIKTKEGYILNKEKKEIKILYNEDLEIEIYNKKEPKGSLEIIKKDKETKELLEGIIFEIQYANGTKIGEYTTDANGKIFIDNLKVGKVIIKEKSTKNGYILNKEKIEVNIQEDKIVKIDIYNEKEPRGGLKIIKIDKETNKKLQGVKFEIKYKNGDIIGNYITDENGEILVKDLKTEEIIIKEINTLEGYELDKKEKKIEIIKNKTIEIEINNKKIPEEPKIEIPKEPEMQEEVEILPRTGEDGIKINLIKYMTMLTCLLGRILLRKT